METRIELKQGWKILQDVHDTGEKIGLYAAREADTSVGSQVSEWEELEELKHLQLIYARQPYFGRELRYFNQAPWWYKTEFEVPDQNVRRYLLPYFFLPGGFWNPVHPAPPHHPMENLPLQ